MNEEKCKTCQEKEELRLKAERLEREVIGLRSLLNNKDKLWNIRKDKYREISRRKRPG